MLAVFYVGLYDGLGLVCTAQAINISIKVSTADWIAFTGDILYGKLHFLSSGGSFKV